MSKDTLPLKIDLLRKGLQSLDRSIKIGFENFEKRLDELEREVKGGEKTSEVNYPSLQGVKNLCVAPPSVWIDSRGEGHHIRGSMETSHIRACIDYLETAYSELDKAQKRILIKMSEFKKELNRRS